MTTVYPTAEEVARQFLLHKLGKTLEVTSYEALAEQEPGGWPTTYLENGDLKFLETLGIMWHKQPRNNGITTLLGEYFVTMNDKEVSLELVDIDTPAYIGFVSLRT